MPNYQFREANEAQRNAMQAIRKGFETLEELMLLYIVPSRETSLAITNLEQAAMWAIKAVHS